MKKNRIFITNSTNRLLEFKPSFLCDIKSVNSFADDDNTKNKIIRKLRKLFPNENITPSTVFIVDYTCSRRIGKTGKYSFVETFDSVETANKYIAFCKRKIEAINKNDLLIKKGKKYQIGDNALSQSLEVLTCADTYLVKTKNFETDIVW